MHKKMIAITLAACCAAGSATAAGFPERPVRMVAASAAGGGTDIIARLLAHKLTDIWGQQAIVDNRPGGGGVIATDITAKAVPDGYTLLLQSVGISYAPALYKKLPFDVRRDIAAVTIVGSQPFVVAVHPSLPAKSVADLAQLAKAKPGDIRFASGGVSGASHLGSELFRVTAGVNMVHVPYKGTGPAITAMLGNETSAFMSTFASALPHIKSGRLRTLGVTTSKRSRALPDVPTIAESGVPGFEYATWYGVLGPNGIPKPIVDKLNKSIVSVLNMPEVVKRYDNQGMDVRPSTVAEFRALLKSETDKWAKVVRDAKIPQQ